MLFRSLSFIRRSAARRPRLVLKQSSRFSLASGCAFVFDYLAQKIGCWAYTARRIRVTWLVSHNGRENQGFLNRPVPYGWRRCLNNPLQSSLEISKAAFATHTRAGSKTMSPSINDLIQGLFLVARISFKGECDSAADVSTPHVYCSR